ncbi:MAG: hypothetical protein KAI67_05075 [Candidatus Pacebacteria bacterium]|nr:hypothetical protein [Candidatus Paceibacterota bacterium]
MKGQQELEVLKTIVVWTERKGKELEKNEQKSNRERGEASALNWIIQKIKKGDKNLLSIRERKS